MPRGFTRVLKIQQMRARLRSVFVIVLLSHTGSLHAQSTSADGSSVTGQSGLFTMATASTLRSGQWLVSGYLDNKDYLFAPAPELRPVSRRSYRDMDVDHSEGGITAAYGISDRIELAAAIPYVRFYQNAGDLAGYINGTPHVGRLEEYGLGSLRVAAKYALGPLAARSSYAISGFGEIPIGDDDKITSGSANFGAGIHWDSSKLSLAATYRATGTKEREAAPAFDIADEVRIDAGFRVPLGQTKRMEWISELNGIAHVGGDRQPADTLFVISGVRRRFAHGWGLSAAVRVNVTMAASANKSHPIGGYLALHRLFE